MARPRGRTKTARLTVNLEPHEYATLTALAHQQDVPLSWLIRRAVMQLLANNNTEIQPELPLPKNLILIQRAQR